MKWMSRIVSDASACKMKWMSRIIFMALFLQNHANGYKINCKGSKVRLSAGCYVPYDIPFGDNSHIRTNMSLSTQEECRDWCEIAWSQGPGNLDEAIWETHCCVWTGSSRCKFYVGGYIRLLDNGGADAVACQRDLDEDGTVDNIDTDDDGDSKLDTDELANIVKVFYLDSDWGKKCTKHEDCVNRCYNGNGDNCSGNSAECACGSHRGTAIITGEFNGLLPNTEYTMTFEPLMSDMEHGNSKEKVSYIKINGVEKTGGVGCKPSSIVRDYDCFFRSCHKGKINNGTAFDPFPAVSDANGKITIEVEFNQTGWDCDCNKNTNECLPNGTNYYYKKLTFPNDQIIVEAPVNYTSIEAAIRVTAMLKTTNPKYGVSPVTHSRKVATKDDNVCDAGTEFYGPKCEACTCNGSACSGGVSGDGSCSCPPLGTYSAECTPCITVPGCTPGKTMCTNNTDETCTECIDVNHTGDKCDCKKGYYANGNACVLCTTIKDCEDGSTLCTNSNNQTCSKCRFGDVSTTTSNCLAVAGYYKDANSIKKCPLGTYKAGDGDAQALCLNCASNYVTLSEGSTSSAHCKAASGYYVANNGQVTACAADTYKTGVGNDLADCVNCPLNTSTKNTGSTASADCVPNAGYYKDNTGKIKQCATITNCANGKTTCMSAIDQLCSECASVTVGTLILTNGRCEIDTDNDGEIDSTDKDDDGDGIDDGIDSAPLKPDADNDGVCDGSVSVKKKDGAFICCGKGNYGILCDKQCPGSNAKTCNGKGMCNDGIDGDGKCTCDKDYSGVSCQTEVKPDTNTNHTPKIPDAPKQDKNDANDNTKDKPPKLEEEKGEKGEVVEDKSNVSKDSNNWLMIILVTAGVLLLIAIALYYRLIRGIRKPGVVGGGHRATSRFANFFGRSRKSKEDSIQDVENGNDAGAMAVAQPVDFLGTTSNTSAAL